MKEMELKYGCNPNQKPARIFMKEGELPITILNGNPGYINLLDAFNSWQLVKVENLMAIMHICLVWVMRKMKSLNIMPM